MTAILLLTVLGIALMASVRLYGNVQRLPGPIDSLLQLANADNVTATGDFGDVVDLGEGFAPDPVLPVRLGLNVTVLDETTGNETYELTVKESADNVTWSITPCRFTIGSTGTYHVIAGVTQRYVKLVAALAGTTPSLTGSAWLVPIRA